MTTRTDAHRPSVIVPAEYSYVLSYSLPSSMGGFPVPAFGINCENEGDAHHASGRCCVVGLRKIANVAFASTGGTGSCSVCGAAFVHGDVWVHDATGEHIHLGHTCAAKYELLADRSAWELERERRAAASARAVRAALNSEERQAFLDSHPGLEGVLSLNHHILADMARRFQEYRSLSPKQIELAFKIAAEILFPAPVEVNVPAPEGRMVVRGEIVSVKGYESQFGWTTKVTIKVRTDKGVWLAWGTLPSSASGASRGDTIELTATLQRGREAHFAFFKRPTKAVVTGKDDEVEAEPVKVAA